uniref:DDE Tnp4 domain-containing protein n=1 Tax=Neolamprologus brichardi TaxID=32507 RepID=A0A3Q4HZG7_NEOBR
MSVMSCIYLHHTRPLYCRINLSVPVLDRFFNNEDTRPDFRLSRESVTALLNLLNQQRRHGWGAPIEALVFLFWLASGAAYRVVSRVFAIPRSTVHRIVHRVTEVVVATRHQVIHLPRTPEDLDAMSNGFAQLAGHRAFVKAAGAIDCCHVRIKNRKLFPSIILQAVCDHEGRFVDTHVGLPGSVHDSRVLRHSPLYRQARYPPPGHFILADGGYPCPQHPLPLITPYKRPVYGAGAQRFNAHHSSLEVQVLEVHHTFVPHVRHANTSIICILWHVHCTYKIKHLSQVITACAVLHNICIGGHISTVDCTCSGDTSYCPRSGTGFTALRVCAFMVTWVRQVSHDSP